MICGHHQMNHLVQSYLRVKHDQCPIILMIEICVAHVVETLHWSTAEHWSLITITGLCSGLHWSPPLIGITCYHSGTAVLWPLTNNIVIHPPFTLITTNSDNCCSQLCTWYLHFTSLLVFQSKHEGDIEKCFSSVVKNENKYLCWLLFICLKWTNVVRIMFLVLSLSQHESWIICDGICLYLNSRVTHCNSNPKLPPNSKSLLCRGVC